jgi:hypothetical protein
VVASAIRPGEEDDRVGWGGAGWLGHPKAETQWRMAAVAQWEGKGDGACRGGRRGGPRLGHVRSQA